MESETIIKYLMEQNQTLLNIIAGAYTPIAPLDETEIARKELSEMLKNQDSTLAAGEL